MEINQIERDKQLVQQALSQPLSNALSKLLDFYWIPVFNYINKMIANDDFAEDLTMEAFGKAFSKIDKYDFNYAFSTWLYRIAGNTAIDYLRKQKLENPFSSFIIEDEDGNISNYIETQLLQSTNGALTQEEKMIVKENSLALKKVIEKLATHHQQILELRYFEELSYEEIANKLNIPITSVKVQLFRAKNLLQKIYVHYDR